MFMSVWKDNHRIVYATLLAIYVLVVVGITLLIRESSGKVFIQTEWLRGFRSSNPKIYKDNICNLLLFVPIGVLVGLVSILCSYTFIYFWE